MRACAFPALRVSAPSAGLCWRAAWTPRGSGDQRGCLPPEGRGRQRCARRPSVLWLGRAPAPGGAVLGPGGRHGAAVDAGIHPAHVCRWPLAQGGRGDVFAKAVLAPGWRPMPGAGRRLGTEPGPSCCIRAAPKGRPQPGLASGPLPVLRPPATSQLFLPGASLSRPPSCQLCPSSGTQAHASRPTPSTLKHQCCRQLVRVGQGRGRSGRVRDTPPLLRALLAGWWPGPGGARARAHRQCLPG